MSKRTAHIGLGWTIKEGGSWIFECFGRSARYQKKRTANRNIRRIVDPGSARDSSRSGTHVSIYPAGDEKTARTIEDRGVARDISLVNAATRSLWEGKIQWAGNF